MEMAGKNILIVDPTEIMRNQKFDADNLAGNLEESRAGYEVREYIRELKRSNDFKDLFIDILRHDLLNHLTVIKNTSSILAADDSLKARRRELQLIEKHIEKVGKIIEEASSFTRLENIEKIDFAERNLNAIFKEVIHDFEPMLEEKRMKVEYKAKGRCLARVNPVIEDVFANLLSNAIKYSPEHSKIVIGIGDDSDELRVMVKDYGEGIPDESKEAIFERFRRGGKKGVKGTGLGLAIVKRVVELHNGRVWVEDSPEGGSIFYVTIPKNEVIEMSKIMVVDDEPDAIFILKTLLSREGYEVIAAQDGEECLQKLGEVKPDLILLDVMMPDIDGWEVSKRVKENQSTSSIIVLILSVRGSEEDKKRSFEYAHADGHLTKPIDSKEIISTVKAFLKKVSN